SLRIVCWRRPTGSRCNGPARAEIVSATSSLDDVVRRGQVARRRMAAVSAVQGGPSLEFVDAVEIGLARQPVFQHGLHAVDRVHAQLVVVGEREIGLGGVLVRVYQGNAQRLAADDVPAPLFGERLGGLVAYEQRGACAPFAAGGQR